MPCVPLATPFLCLGVLWMVLPTALSASFILHRWGRGSPCSVLAVQLPLSSLDLKMCLSSCLGGRLYFPQDLSGSLAVCEPVLGKMPQQLRGSTHQGRVCLRQSPAWYFCFRGFFWWCWVLQFQVGGRKKERKGWEGEGGRESSMGRL